MRWQSTLTASVILIFISSFSCKKETIIVTDNDAPLVNNVPSIKIENFINRVFIDLLGREPINSEMAVELQKLKDGDLTKESRAALISQLQNSTAFVVGDTSYQRAYNQYMYDLAKVHFLEGVSDATIQEFANGGSEGDLVRITLALNARKDLQDGVIVFAELFGRMTYNIVFDEINMNSFNFVNASFDNLFWRYPTDAEFDAGYSMIEYNISASLFNQFGRNKTEYVNILINSNEMYEGMIIWAYQQLISRRPTTEETAFLLEDFIEHKDMRLIQEHIMTTDEYANF